MLSLKVKFKKVKYTMRNKKLDVNTHQASLSHLKIWKSVLRLNQHHLQEYGQ